MAIGRRTSIAKNMNMKENNTIDLRRLGRAMFQLRWVYLAAIVVAGLAAGIYVSRMLPEVPVTGQMLIGEESIDTSAGAQIAAKGAGGVSQMLKTFSVGGFGAAAVDNEVLIAGSHEVLKNTVKALNLNRSYIGKTAEGKRKMLFRDMPVTVEAPAEYFDTLSTAYTVNISLLDGGKADVTIKKGLFKRVIAEASGIQLPGVVRSPLGTIQIHRTDAFEKSPYREVTVKVAGNNIAAENLYQEVEIDVASKLSDIIRIDLNYPDPELGKAIVNGIMSEYNSLRLGRIHETARNTIKYFDERLAETLGQLENAEQKVADYRRSNSIVAPEAEAQGLLGMTNEQKLSAMNASNQLDYYNKVAATLRSSLDGNTLIPQIESMGDTSIAAYNYLILQKRRLEQSATPENPRMILVNERLSTLRDLILENSEKSIAKARKDIGFQFGLAGKADSRLNRYPGMELELTALSRDRSFQASLYQFLVQSRENAVLKMYADTDVGYVFQPAYVGKTRLPVKRIMLVVIAVILAIMAVSVLALIVMWRSRNVHEPMDVAFMGVGEHTVTEREPDSLLRLRSMIMARNDIRVIYAADFTGSDSTLRGLTDSFASTGREVTVLEADSNSALLTPTIAATLSDVTNGESFALVKVPEPESLFVIEKAVDGPGACLLAIVPRIMRRRNLKRYLKGQTAARVYIFITG